MYTVTIRKEHCVNTEYTDCKKCAGAKAFMEQHPTVPFSHYNEDRFTLKDDTILLSDKPFAKKHFDMLLLGEIDEYVMTIPGLKRFYKEEEERPVEIKSEFIPVTFKEIKIPEHSIN